MTTAFAETARPSTSMWDRVQQAERIAPGMWQVSTAGHGGIILSGERNRLVPHYMRAENGQYEEDCHWAVVALIFPDTFREKVAHDGKTHYEHAVQTMQQWMPDEYARFLADKTATAK